MSSERSAPDHTPAYVRVWVCPTCGYWRQEKSSGVHTADNPEDWRKKPVSHQLVEAQYIFEGQTGA